MDEYDKQIDELFRTETETTGKTMYHGGFDLLKRLDRILIGIDLVKIPKQQETHQDILIRYSQRLQLLNSLFMELSPLMESEEQEESKKQYKEIKLKLTSVQNQAQRSSKHSMIGIELEEKYNTWELKLRQIHYKKGLHMPDKLTGMSATGA